MKTTFKANFIHGHFIEAETNKRIIPSQGAIYEISGEIDTFKKEDEILKYYTDGRSSEEKRISVNDRYGKENVIKIADAYTKLAYRIGNSKKIDGDESSSYVFTCTLLEDLYMYKKSQKIGDEEKDWRLDDCMCVLENCVYGGLIIRERFSTSSLNKLFAYTVAFYFNMQRSTVCNAFKTFCFFEDKMHTMTDGFYHELFQNLGHERKRVVEYINKTVSRNKT